MSYSHFTTGRSIHIIVSPKEATTIAPSAAAFDLGGDCNAVANCNNAEHYSRIHSSP